MSNELFQNEKHEKRFRACLSHFAHTYVIDAPFKAMIYLATTDFLYEKFEKLIVGKKGDYKISVRKMSSVDFSSSQKFMMKFALGCYFSIKSDYSFQKGFYELLDSDNQALVMNTLKFLRRY